MAIESKFKRITDPADPRRCQAVHGNGQCIYLAEENSNFCIMHGGHGAKNTAKKEQLHKYLLAQWQARTDDFAEDNSIKSLRGEIGILRMTLEQTITQCNNPMDVVLWSDKIGGLVQKIEKVVVSCHRLETSSGRMLDRTAALQLAAQIVDIISNHIVDPAIVEGISGDIINAIAQINSSEKTE